MNLDRFNNGEDLQWPWGEIRGGTPAVLDGDHYLAIFHSSEFIKAPQINNKNALFYFMGAYTFSSQPPFEIQKMSPHPIVAKGFYDDGTFILFPCGLLVEGNDVWVTFGKKDCEVWITRMDKKKLLESLVSVNPKEKKEKEEHKE